MRKVISFLATLCATAVTLTVLTFGVAAFADTMGWRITSPASLTESPDAEDRNSVVAREQQSDLRS